MTAPTFFARGIKVETFYEVIHPDASAESRARALAHTQALPDPLLLNTFELAFTSKP